MIDRLFKRLQIRHLYFWSTTIFVVLLFSVFIWTNYYFSVQSTVRTTSAHQTRILSLLNEKLGAQLALIESVSLSASRNNDLLKLFELKSEPYERLLAVQDATASLQTLTFSTPSILDIEVYMTNAPRSGKREPVRFVEFSEIDKDYGYNQIRNSDFAWIGEHETESYQGAESVVSFARKVYTSGGDYAALVILNMRAADVRQMLREEGVESNRLLLDSGGRLITTIGSDHEGAGRIADYVSKEVLTDPGQPSNGYRLIPSDSLIVWTKVKGSNANWLLVEQTTWTQLVEGTSRTARLLLTIGVTAIFMLLLYFYFLNRKFTGPIMLLLRAMNQFPERWKFKLPEDYRNEFGRLFGGYRGLLLKIDELYESLRVQYRKQKETEIRSLQAMINPHFLYNTLDQLNWMAIKDGNDRMSRVLELTGRMLRIGLSEGRSIIPLTDEVELIECYMQIQQIRLGDAIRYSIELPEDLRTCLVPKMTLQPFVENSIRHGFHGRKHGHIAIRCERIGLSLRITIEDDGRGLPADIGRLSSKTRGGYGIRNVKERFLAHYGAQEVIRVANRSTGGTVVTLNLPFINGESSE